MTSHSTFSQLLHHPEPVLLSAGKKPEEINVNDLMAVTFTIQYIMQKYNLLISSYTEPNRA